MIIANLGYCKATSKGGAEIRGYYYYDTDSGCHCVRVDADTDYFVDPESIRFCTMLEGATPRAWPSDSSFLLFQGDVCTHPEWPHSRIVIAWGRRGFELEPENKNDDDVVWDRHDYAALNALCWGDLEVVG